MKNSTKQKEKSGKKNDAITGKIKQKGNQRNQQNNIKNFNAKKHSYKKLEKLKKQKERLLRGSTEH